MYYLQSPPGCGRIYFHDPRVQAHVMNPRFDPDRERAAESWSEVYFEPIPGRLLLFPAWLLHEVQPNMTESTGATGDRISISFNFHQQLREGARADFAAGHDAKGGITRSKLPPAG